MDRQTEIIEIRKIFEETHDGLNVGKMGTLAILKYLYVSKIEVTSKQLSDILKVSSARMTVLLKKLEEDGLIIKTNSKHDARAINITLTEVGYDKSKEMELKFVQCINNLLDLFGYERLTNLLRDMQKLRVVFKDAMNNEFKEFI